MRFLACHLAIALWIGDGFGSWFDLCSHDTVLELSDKLSMHGCGHLSSFSEKYAPITDPMYSFVLRVKVRCSSIENWYRHSMFDVRLYPPIPVSLESVIGAELSCLKMTLLMDMPFLAVFRNFNHSTRSFLTSSGIWVVFVLFARSFIRLVRFIKCLAAGMMQHACSSLPTRVASSL